MKSSTNVYKGKIEVLDLPKKMMYDLFLRKSCKKSRISDVFNCALVFE